MTTLLGISPITTSQTRLLIGDREPSLFPKIHRAKVSGLLEEYGVRGFKAHHHPLDDEQVPEMGVCLRLLDSLCASLKAGNRVALQ